MKLQRIGRILSVFLLLGVFFYSTSVRELHYAFSTQHHSAAHTDNCDHHIHSSDKEGDCLICKIDVIGVFDISHNYYSFSVVFLPLERVVRPEEVFFSTPCHAHYLRGPPSLV